MTRIPNAPSSEMSTAARNAPAMLPIPPTTTTTKTAARMLKSMRRSAPPFGSWAAPPRPASIEPRKKVPVNSHAWLTPSAPTISRSSVAARTSVPHRVR